MQKIIVILFLFTASLALSTSPLRAQPPTPARAQSPAQAQPVRSIGVAGLDDYIRQCDHPLIVNYWATYCSPCLKEIPYLQSTVEKYRDSGVELLLVSLDLSISYPQQIVACARQWNITAKIVWLDTRDPDFSHVRIDPKWSGSIPVSLFINNSTRYRKFFDRQLTDRQVEQQLKLLVKPSEQP